MKGTGQDEMAEKAPSFLEKGSSSGANAKVNTVRTE